MRIFIPILMLCYCSQAVPGGEAEDALSIRGYEELTLCVTEYKRLTGEPIADEIDRAYIDVFKNLDVVAFTEGAVGTFGKRSPTYRSHVVCAVKQGEVVDLTAPLMQLWVDKSGDDISEANKEYQEGTVIELLYLRDGDRFEFCCSQPFDEKNIDKHNPDRKRQILDALNGKQ
ncbi:MAG: hypothetical protein OXE42_12190 [Gammaproteobacteria bacterium]|nr:hypothetical protein [Gammaproteobacteria bacterium]